MSSEIRFSDNVPKYLQFAALWRERIASGSLQPGDRLPSFARLREEGATQATAEKAFTILEKEGLILREAGKGVFVAKPQIARTRVKAVRKKQSGVIGVSGVGFEFDSYAAYWVQLLKGIRQAARQSQMQVLLLDHRSSNGWEKADGILVCDWSLHNTLDLIAPHQPRVSVMVDSPGTASVLANDYAAGYDAARHLLELGHRNIAYLHGPDMSVVPHRLSGYREALADAGVIPDGRWTRIMTGFHRNIGEFESGARRTMCAWLANDWNRFGFTGLLCQNDAVALSAIEALEERGLRVPGDISVVGFDGAEIAANVPGGLTTMEVPLVEIGRKSVEVLLNQIAADEVSDEHHILPIALRQGGTTAAVKK